MFSEANIHGRQNKILTYFGTKSLYFRTCVHISENKYSWILNKFKYSWILNKVRVS
jgi:hypothetical protein